MTNQHTKLRDVAMNCPNDGLRWRARCLLDRIDEVLAEADELNARYRDRAHRMLHGLPPRQSRQENQ
jgi:hypothetical protein